MAKKPSRPLSYSLRVVIAAGSVGAFLGGWALLAHSPNPYENAQAAPMDAPVLDTPSSGTQLPALPTPRAQNSQNFQQTQPLQLQPQFGTQSVSPFRQRRMRTGGS